MDNMTSKINLSRFSIIWFGIGIIGIIAIIFIAIILNGFSARALWTDHEPSNLDYTKSWHMTNDWQNINNYKLGVDEFNPLLLPDLIDNARNDAEAKISAEYWLNTAKTSPGMLAGCSQIFLNQPVDVHVLVNQGSWSTDTAIDILGKIRNEITQSKITTSVAPQDGYEYIIVGNRLILNANDGVDGDRNAIKIVLKNNKTIYVIARGNIVSKERLSSIPDTYIIP